MSWWFITAPWQEKIGPGLLMFLPRNGRRESRSAGWRSRAGAVRLCWRWQRPGGAHKCELAQRSLTLGSRSERTGRCGRGGHSRLCTVRHT